jgi:hypothetical protein
MDNTKKTGSPDSKTINLSEDYEVAYWIKVLGVSKKQLADAIAAVGKSVDAVRKHLNK